VRFGRRRRSHVSPVRGVRVRSAEEQAFPWHLGGHGRRRHGRRGVRFRHYHRSGLDFAGGGTARAFCAGFCFFGRLERCRAVVLCGGISAGSGGLLGRAAVTGPAQSVRAARVCTAADAGLDGAARGLSATSSRLPLPALRRSPNHNRLQRFHLSSTPITVDGADRKISFPPLTR